MLDEQRQSTASTPTRCVGQLLKEFDAQGKRTDLEAKQPLMHAHERSKSRKTKTQAATEAGMSKRQKDEALAVANVPEGGFDIATESDKPVTRRCKSTRRGFDCERPALAES